MSIISPIFGTPNKKKIGAVDKDLNRDLNSDLKSIGNKILTIQYRPKKALFTVPIAKVFKEKEGYIVISAKTLRRKVLMSAQQIYYGGKKNVDYKVFKTISSTEKYINKLKENVLK